MWDDALSTFNIGLEYCKNAYDEDGIREYYIWESNVYYHAGLYGRAIESATKGLNCQITDYSRSGDMAYYLGKPYLLLGDVQKYIDLQYKAIKLIEPLDKKLIEYDMAWDLTYLAEGLGYIGDFDSAYEIISEQVPIFKKLNQDHGIPYGLFVLGKIAMGLNKYDEAESALQEAFTLYEKLKRESFVVDIFVEFSKLAIKKNDIWKAKHYVDKAIEEARKGPRESEGLADSIHLNYALVQGAKVYLTSGETEKGQTFYKEAFNLAVDTSRKLLLKELSMC